MREKLREILTNEDKVIIWDVDGVLAAYEYGERNHNACLDLEWDEYLKEHDVYETARPLATLQRWMAEHASSKRMFVCTTASNMEEFKRKAAFVIRNYPIQEKSIFMVKDQTEKLDIIKQIHNTYFPELEEQYVIVVDDTVKILTHVQENSGYSTIHISAFIN
jgi:phosphoglycolate phosphatase-like HAD superfamily hydrolase